MTHEEEEEYVGDSWYAGNNDEEEDSLDRSNWLVQESNDTERGETHEDVFFGSSHQLNQGEAMLLDTGAWNNLVGSQWVERMDALNGQAGGKGSVRSRLPHTLTLGGVGKHSQKSNHSVKVNTFISGDTSTYEATVIDNSKLPALLGVKSL